jgi:hypothetical protein
MLDDKLVKSDRAVDGEEGVRPLPFDRYKKVTMYTPLPKKRGVPPLVKKGVDLRIKKGGGFTY